jgi:hypothetical protein
MSEMQKQEKNSQFAQAAEAYSINDWSLKIREGNGRHGTIALDGEDVIIVEDIGNPLVKMKPIHGDFSIIQYFTACATGWMASLKRSDGEIFDAAEIWLQFKAFKEKLGVTATDFLDQMLPDTGAYVAGRF